LEVQELNVKKKDSHELLYDVIVTSLIQLFVALLS